MLTQGGNGAVPVGVGGTGFVLLAIGILLSCPEAA